LQSLISIACSTFYTFIQLYQFVNYLECAVIERHRGNVVWLEYVGEGNPDATLMLVGKGVTYDTGGADIKAGGIMVGMSRDKCGAAAIAGFFQVHPHLWD
jgi:hypothetical protein